MAANLIQIVDDIKSSPTVLLDLNAGADTQYGFSCARFDAPPPPLRYTTSSSMLSDGDRISASSYANRTLTLSLDLIQSSQDTLATSWQTLARLIDQDTFWLKYQPTGATSPVFFQCYRTQVPGVEIVNGATAYTQFTISIPADPGAWGLPVDQTATITNDPTTGTNKQTVGVTTPTGDLETPLLVAQTTGPGVTRAAGLNGGQGVAVLSSYFVTTGTHTLLARDLTELTSGTDVGAPVTGAGTNYIGGNYKACTFVTTAMAVRFSGAFSTTFTPMPGTYRVFIRGVAPAGSGTAQAIMYHQLGVLADGASTYTYLPQVSNNVTYVNGSDQGNLLDLGVVQFPLGSPPGRVGLGPAVTASRATSISIKAGWPAGSLPFRYDEIYFLPIDTTYGTGNIAYVTEPSWNASVQHNVVAFDGINDQMRTLYDSSGTAPFAGIPTPAAPPGGIYPNMQFIGGLPVVRPNVNNYLTWMYEETAVTGTSVLTMRYYPRYLYVRPAST